MKNVYHNKFIADINGLRKNPSFKKVTFKKIKTKPKNPIKNSKTKNFQN